MTPLRAAVHGLVLRVRVQEPALLGPGADRSSWLTLARAATGRAVILDFAGVSRLDARGLGILASFAEAVHARGGCIRLARMRPYVRRMVDLTGLAAIIGPFERKEPGGSRAQVARGCAP
jgi:anti-anti-sigma factor